MTARRPHQILPGIAFALCGTACGAQGDQASEASGATRAAETATPPSDDVATSASPSIPSTPVAPATNAGPILVQSWTTTAAPSSCVNGLSNPISGCDPLRDDAWPMDCDEDGATDYLAFDCNPNNTDVVPLQPGYDCSPNDPAHSLWIAADRDGDGYSVDSEFNCSGPEVPEGFVPGIPASPADCDDQQSAVHPNSPETWGDGVDSDCLNGDAPDCRTLQAGVPISTRAPDLGPCPDGPNVHFSPAIQCGRSTCGDVGSFYLIVSNSGNAATAAGMSLSWTDDDGVKEVVTLDPIEPGSTSPPVAVQYSETHTIELQVNAADCSPESDVLVVDTNWAPGCAR